jgi:acetyl esterase/lipase
MNVPTAQRWRLRAPIAVVLCALAAAPAAASANALPAKALTLPVRTSASGEGYGTAALKVIYTETEAAATVTGTTLSLPPNGSYRVIACLRGYSPARVHTNTCVTKGVSTTVGFAFSARAEPAPTVTASMPRPPQGGAWFTYEVDVQQLRDGWYRPIASTWPATGVAGASIGVPARGATTSPAPRSAGIAVSGGATGGINANQPDAFCAGIDQPDGAPVTGVNTTALGSGAPAYYEIGQPTGDFAGRAPKGVMVIIHGGGWVSGGPGALAAMRGDADRWRARGWRTLNVSYRPCSDSLTDVLWFYDQARRLWGDSLPYCAMGASAGGHLALALAAVRDGVDCVIDQSGPTDVQTLRDESTPTGGTDAPRRVYNMMVAAVGPDNLRWWSPAQFPERLAGTRILYASAVNDAFTPFAQGTELRDNIKSVAPGAYVDLMQLAKGSVQWVHNPVTADALQAYYDREKKLVAPLG